MFDSVVANKATVDMLTRAVGEGRLPHALIIEGRIRQRTAYNRFLDRLGACRRRCGDRA